MSEYMNVFESKSDKKEVFIKLFFSKIGKFLKKIFSYHNHLLIVITVLFRPNTLE